MTTSKQAMAELSAEPLESMPTLPKPSELEDHAHELFQAAVVQPTKAFREKLTSEPAAADALKNFLSQARVDKAKTWRQLFKARPPRGALFRLARRCHANLHKTCRFQGYTTLRGFKTKMKRIRKWYTPGRKVSRRKIGIKRRRHESEHVRGIKKAVTKRVLSHFRRLFRKRRLEGLWNWHLVARDILRAGAPMQTWTLPCERYWASLLQM